MKKNKHMFKRIIAITLASTLIFSSYPQSKLKAATTFSITKKVTIGKGETFQLNVESSSKISFQSSNKKIVSVTKSGKIKGKKVGKATIIAKSNKKTQRCKVTVKAAPKKISFSQKKIILIPNETQKLAVTFASGYSNKVTFHSKDTSVITVSSKGIVKAKSPGETTIIAKTFNRKTATIRCIVADTPLTDTITPSAIISSTPCVTPTDIPQTTVTTFASISKMENGTIYIDNNTTTLSLTSCITYYKTNSDGTLYDITKNELLPGDTIEITYNGRTTETYPATLCECEKIVVTNSPANTIVEDKIFNISNEHTLKIVNHSDTTFYFDTNTKIYKNGHEITSEQLKNDDVIRICADTLKNTVSSASIVSYTGYAKTIVILGDSVYDLSKEEETFSYSYYYDSEKKEELWNTSENCYLVTNNTLLEITQPDGSIQYATISTTTNPLPIRNMAITVYYETILGSSLRKAVRISYKALSFQSYPICYKPVIYLYPEKKTDVCVDLDFDGKLTYTYPYTENGHWKVTADTDGSITNKVDDLEYSYLFWEGIPNNFTADFSKGFCVKGEDTTKFLQTVLPQIGLTPKEYNEFIVYWAPLMQNNTYNLISFQTENYEAIAPLSINPTPDSMLRVYMAYKPLTSPVDIEPQTFEAFERTGFTVVEWGGCVVND